MRTRSSCAAPAEQASTCSVRVLSEDVGWKFYVSTFGSGFPHRCGVETVLKRGPLKIAPCRMSDGKVARKEGSKRMTLIDPSNWAKM
jgi:hypothetical protein